MGQLQPRDNLGRYGKLPRPEPPQAAPSQSSRNSGPVSLSEASVRRRAKRAGVHFDPNDRLQSIADITAAEAAEACPRYWEARDDAGEIDAVPVMVARELVSRGYRPETAAAAAVQALGVA